MDPLAATSRYAFHVGSPWSVVTVSMTEHVGDPFMAVSTTQYPYWNGTNVVGAQWYSTVLSPSVQFSWRNAVFDPTSPLWTGMTDMTGLYFVSVFSTFGMSTTFSLTLSIVDDFNYLSNSSAVILVDGQPQTARIPLLTNSSLYRYDAPYVNVSNVPSYTVRPLTITVTPLVGTVDVYLRFDGAIPTPNFVSENGARIVV